MGEIETMGSRIDDDDAPLGDGSSTPPTGTPASSRASGAPPALDVPPAPGVPHAFAVPPAPPVPSLRLSELDSVLDADLHPGPEPEEHTSPGVAPPPEPLYAEGAPPSSDRSSEQVSDRPSQRPTRRPGPQVVVGSGSHASRGGEENYAAFAARAGREGAEVEGAVRDGAGLESAVLESAVRDGAELESAGPLEAAAMNVIEEAPVALGPLPSSPNDLEEPVAKFAAVVREDAACAEAARAEAEVARMLRESQVRNRKILAGGGLALLLFALVTWVKAPEAPAPSADVTPAVDTASAAPSDREAPDASKDAQVRAVGSAEGDSSEPEVVGEMAAAQTGKAGDAEPTDARAETRREPGKSSGETKSRPRSSPRRDDPDAPWIRR